MAADHDDGVVRSGRPPPDRRQAGCSRVAPEARLARLASGRRRRRGKRQWTSSTGATAEFHTSKRRLGTFDALRELAAVSLVDPTSSDYYKPSRYADQHSSDKTALWSALCNTTLKPEQAVLLRAVNRLSAHSADDHAWVEMIDHDSLLAALELPDGLDMLRPVSLELEERYMVRSIRRMGPSVQLQATYRGLVWEHKRGFTLESKAIDELVAVWETTSVEFKREQHTNTADEKAELIKDVIALANTQASGRRWLIIGFDDKTHAYHGPPDPKITQEHLEQLLSRYTAPMVDVRYEVVDYRAGQVGKLEVLRDPKRLPYRVAKSIGGKKRIEQGDVFVRHGSLVEEPTPDELMAIEKEAEFAKGA